MFQKIWDNHVVQAEPGKQTVLYIDLQLVHEVTSPQAFEGLRLAGRQVRRPERTVATPDHNVPTTDRSLPMGPCSFTFPYQRLSLEQASSQIVQVEIDRGLRRCAFP